jgi:hypothetical protein
MLRVDAQAEAQLRPPRLRRQRQLAEALPLAEGVEHHVVGDFEDGAQVGLAIGGREDVHLAAVGLAPQPRLVQAAGAGAGEVLRGQRRKLPQGERLQRGQHLHPALSCHPLQQLQVGLDRRLVDDETG